MVESNSTVQELKSSSLILNEFEVENPTRSISNYIERLKTADVEQVKIYLGFVYFAALLFFSITLFL
ncbi:MAG: hypothetical protein IPH62_18475 [Ignavibacteriae bacterium]|nr:hypothetical protein [Ignavibacteriota bacterium]